jgi:hypothetical protein
MQMLFLRTTMGDIGILLIPISVGSYSRVGFGGRGRIEPSCA